jgi:8-amino-7-oxononanoate synthase
MTGTSKASESTVVPSQHWDDAVETALGDRRAANEFRQRRITRALDAVHVEIDGRRYVNFSSNNYLGLTHHPKVLAAFAAASSEYGVGSGAAALVSGYSPAHASAERAIARWKGTESAVLLSSGYAANLAAVQTLAAVAGEKKLRLLIDKLVHASLIDAVRGVCTSDKKVSFRVFPHNHLEKLERLLEEREEGTLCAVVTESIFSMDGDAADLAGIARLKQKYPFLLLLDEAHGGGVYGPEGAGYAAELGLGSIVDVSVVTLSKAIGVVGGAVCGSEKFCDAVVNFGRSYIYSTNLPAAAAAAAEMGLQIMRDEPQRQRRVRALAIEVRRRLAEIGLQTVEGDSPIVPVLIGGEVEALGAAKKLLDGGFLVVAIRPPTVPRGTSRLRITLSSEHSQEEVGGLLAVLGSIM